jgi:hypothetical protein
LCSHFSGTPSPPCRPRRPHEDRTATALLPSGSARNQSITTPKPVRSTRPRTALPACEVSLTATALVVPARLARRYRAIDPTDNRRFQSVLSYFPRISVRIPGVSRSRHRIRRWLRKTNLPGLLSYMRMIRPGHKHVVRSPLRIATSTGRRRHHGPEGRKLSADSKRKDTSR